MYRVLISALGCLALGACSLGATQPLSFGFGDSARSSRDSEVRSGSIGLGGEPANTRKQGGTRVAAMSADHAPKGSFDKAPPGALADRDYSGTALNAEGARDLINVYRKSKGLRPVTLDARLTQAAKAHAKDLAKWDRISHYGSDGSNPWDRVKRAGYNARVVAENVGTGQASFKEVLKAWKNSPGHNRNLLMPDVRNIGIAMVIDSKTEFKTFWTLSFGTRM
ncbi:MAG: CAP domain-containing protein [Hyphomicrobiaceae bacterium]